MVTLSLFLRAAGNQEGRLQVAPCSYPPPLIPSGTPAISANLLGSPAGRKLKEGRDQPTFLPDCTLKRWEAAGWSPLCFLCRCCLLPDPCRSHRIRIRAECFPDCLVYQHPQQISGRKALKFYIAARLQRLSLLYCCVPCHLKRVPICRPSGCETQGSMSYFKGDARLNPKLAMWMASVFTSKFERVGFAGTVSGLRAKG